MTQVADRLAILGLGLIGGSLAAALRRSGAVGQISAFDADPAQLEVGRSTGLIDEAYATPAEAVRGADVVMICVPVSATEAVIGQCADALGEHAVLSDVGSTKQSVIAAVERACGHLPAGFVPGHPIAGTERSGAAAARDDLFAGRRVILTPTARSSADAVARVTALWSACRASVTTMDAAHHDEVLAATSHLPHMLAYTLVDQLAALDSRHEVFAYAAGGFRDFTRIASSNPRMWCDIVSANRDAVLKMIDDFAAHLGDLRESIAAGDESAVMARFERARSARERYLTLVEADAQVNA